MGQLPRIRFYQSVVVTLATLLAVLYLHWFINQPVPVSPGKHDLTFWATLLFWQDIQWSGSAHYFTLVLGLMATTGLAACTLAVLLAVRVPEQISSRRLSRALVGGSLATAYVFFVTAHAEYRAFIDWTPGSPVRLVCDFVAYTAGLLSQLYLALFFLSYPRTLRPEDWEAESLRWRKRAREAIQSPNNWRRWLYPAGLRARMANHDGEKKWFKLTSDTEQAKIGMGAIRIAQSNTAIVVLVAWAMLCAMLDWLDARHAIKYGASATSLFWPGKILVSALACGLLGQVWDIAYRSLHIYASSAPPEDRRKIDWILSTLLVGGILVVCVHLGGMAIMGATVGHLSKMGIYLPASLIVLGPVLVAVELMVLAFVISLALSIFYRGAIDPRLAARKISVFGVLGLVVAVLFVLIERTIALKIVAFFNLSPDTGALIAGATVAATVAPIKNHAEKAINTFVGRFLPLDSMIEGERKTLVVALSDLSGYTLLSSRDEKQALLLAALLQRQAARLTAEHGGRIVKSMGDAVMFAFDDASSAANVLTSLHRDFASAADQFGLTALQVHSGAHVGEVTVAHDGDLYGQTVNIAARIQGAAAAGQIIVSETFAIAAGSFVQFGQLDARKFKNVPDPVSCRELILALPDAVVATAG